MPQNKKSAITRPKNKVSFSDGKINKFSEKSLSRFLTEEEGKITKSNLAKLGLIVVVGAIAAAGAMKAKDVSASCAHSNHSSHWNHWNSHGSHSAHNSGW